MSVVPLLSWDLSSHGFDLSSVCCLPLDYGPMETLLHFAARHGLNNLAQHLLSLPGSSIASVLPNMEGQVPIDIARDNNNEGLVQLLTL